MPKQSMFHSQLEWARERLDEMDTALAALEREAPGTQAASRAKADQTIADLRKRRDAFQQAINAGFEVGFEAERAAWAKDRVLLDHLWNDFAVELNKELQAFGQHVLVHQKMYRDLAAAQQKAWRDASEQLHGAAAQFVAERRAEVERAAQQMKADASKADTRLQKLMGAGKESWAALNAELAESRAAFDRAIQAAGDALKRAAESGADHKRGSQPPR